MTIYEENLLRELADWYIAQVKDAIRNKPIKRKSKSRGEFSAVVNASGALAESLRFEITDTQLVIYCYAYIDNVIFGTPPRQSEFTLFEIEKWMAEKGIDANPATIATSIDRNGTTIWQQYQGQNSGLLSGINIEEKVKELKDKLVLKSIGEIGSDFVKTFKEAA